LALDEGGGELEVPRKVVRDAVDQLRRLLRGEHAPVARRAVHDRRERGDQVARVDDDQVGRQRGEVPALGHEAVAHRPEVRMRQAAREGRLVRAVARRVDGEVDADDAARAHLRIHGDGRGGRLDGLTHAVLLRRADAPPRAV
jgi:hypothetical protein